MKKILSFLIVLGAITFINFDLFASSYNDPVSQQILTLDTPITSLNNKTLNQIYDYSNIFNNINFINYETTHTKTNDTFMTYSIEVISVGNIPAIYANVLTVGNTYYARALMLTENNVNYLNYFVGGDITKYNPTIDEWYLLKSKRIANSSYVEVQARQNILGGVYYIKNPLLINLNLLGLENISETLLDYYYQLYYLLKNELDPSVFYIQGSSVGYGNGLEDYHNGIYNYLDPTQGVPYNDGYDTGNIQGYSDGYDDGLFDYHTGNSYGQYDYTLSEPYDQATQANISLLSVFSLIIGVLMSMLGFIINIEMFGISIASVLGTLAIGVSIIWLLKLIRG